MSYSSTSKGKCVIDYSKWDHLDYDSDCDDQNESGGCAQVTTLDTPSSVTFQPSDQTWAIQPTSPCETSVITTTTSTTTSTTTATQTQSPARVQSKAIDNLIKNGAAYFDPTYNIQTYWAQDRYQVIISISYDSSIVPSSTIRVQATGLVSYSNRFCAVGSIQQSGSLSVYHCRDNHTQQTLLKGTLPHFAHFPEPQEEGEEEEMIDWEIVPDPHFSTTSTQRLIRITFGKAVPMAGLVIWWKQPLMHFPEIDLQAIHGRNTSETQASNRMKDAWDEAHRLFREKVQSRGRIDV